jgi:16S rRNA (guanine966-N2)-methyltransferase
MRRRNRAAPPPTGLVRIIGGTWRGRRLAFDATEGLRPTPDRVRETLFNWLQPWIEGARCLDLFAGSGVLGLEALSRGASSAVLVDASAAAIAALRRNLALLDATGATAVHAEAAAWLAGATGGNFDLVFLDPPYHQGMVGRCAAALDAAGLLAPGAMIYVETAADEAAPLLPPAWTAFRDKRAGQVAYRLFRNAPP